MDLDLNQLSVCVLTVSSCNKKDSCCLFQPSAVSSSCDSNKDDVASMGKLNLNLKRSLSQIVSSNYALFGRYKSDEIYE